MYTHSSMQRCNSPDIVIEDPEIVYALLRPDTRAIHTLKDTNYRFARIVLVNHRSLIDVVSDGCISCIQKFGNRTQT